MTTSKKTSLILSAIFLPIIILFVILFTVLGPADERKLAAKVDSKSIQFISLSSEDGDNYYIAADIASCKLPFEMGNQVITLGENKYRFGFATKFINDARVKGLQTSTEHCLIRYGIEAQNKSLEWQNYPHRCDRILTTKNGIGFRPYPTQLVIDKKTGLINEEKSLLQCFK